MAGSWNMCEYMVYGHYNEDVLTGEGHFEDRTNLCQPNWSITFTENELSTWVENLSSEKVAIGLQSYIDIKSEHLCMLLGL